MIGPQNPDPSTLTKQQPFLFLITLAAFSKLAGSLWMYCSSHLYYLRPAIHQPPAQSLTASAAQALGRTHADQLIKNHLVENTNKAVSLWLALGIGVRGDRGGVE